MNGLDIRVLGFVLLFFLACNPPVSGSDQVRSSAITSIRTDSTSMSDTATFAGGCFWCTEAIFQEIDGVDTVISGYTGGKTVNPTYQQVLRGRTGHAEAIQVIYNPQVVTYDRLLAAFFTAHDPTQLNRQGNDVGTQYRSAIFFHNEMQKEKVAYYIRQLIDKRVFPKPIVTQVEPFTIFYQAEDYHQNYFRNNPEQAYCQYIILPKLKEFREVFPSLIL